MVFHLKITESFISILIIVISKSLSKTLRWRRKHSSWIDSCVNTWFLNLKPICFTSHSLFECHIHIFLLMCIFYFLIDSLNIFKMCYHCKNAGQNFFVVRYFFLIHKYLIYRLFNSLKIIKDIEYLLSIVKTSGILTQNKLW